MYEINEKVTFHIQREEVNFDRACDEGYRRACSILGWDEDGHLTNVKSAKRSMSIIVLEFKKFTHSAGMMGHEFLYWFETWVEQ